MNATVVEHKNAKLSSKVLQESVLTSYMPSLPLQSNTPSNISSNMSSNNAVKSGTDSNNVAEIVAEFLTPHNEENKQEQKKEPSQQGFCETDNVPIHNDESAGLSQSAPQSEIPLPLSPSTPTLSPSSPTRSPLRNSDYDGKEESKSDSDSSGSDVESGSEDEKDGKSEKKQTTQSGAMAALPDSKLLPTEPIAYTRKARFRHNLTHFISKCNRGNPITELFLFVSLGPNRDGKNPETGSDLEAFIDLVNRSGFTTGMDNEQTYAISKIIVVLSGDLYAAYVGKEKAEKVEKDWRENEGKLLATKLNSRFNFKAKSDIWGWDRVSDERFNPLYNKALTAIQDLFATDKEFQEIILKQLIPQHRSKYRPHEDEKAADQKGEKVAAEEAVKKYVFGESAVFLTFGKIVCYPAPNFNAAVQYVLKKLVLEKLEKGQSSPYPGSKYIGYEFYELKNKVPTVISRSKGENNNSEEKALFPKVKGKIKQKFPFKMQGCFRGIDTDDVRICLTYGIFQSNPSLWQMVVDIKKDKLMLEQDEITLAQKRLALAKKELEALELIGATASKISTHSEGVMSMDTGSSLFTANASTSGSSSSASVSVVGGKPATAQTTTQQNDSLSPT